MEPAFDIAADIAGKALAALLSLFLLAACPARAEAPAPDAPHAGTTR